MNFVHDFFRKIQLMRLKNITLENVERKMNDEGFDPHLQNELIELFQNKIEQEGEDAFKLWLYNLNFSIIEQFQDERAASELYDRYKDWFKQQLTKLEEEYGIPFEEQARDIQHINIKAQKAQLVLRDRLTVIILNLY